MDFVALSPLELMSLADRERVHTAFLGWLLGRHSPFPVAQRATIATSLAGLPDLPNPTCTDSRVEVEKLDLLVTVESDLGEDLFAVEAKLKSKEHSEQLDHYDAMLDARRKTRCSRVFLTLDGTPPKTNGRWKPVSYADVHAAVDREYRRSGSENVYVRDYLALISRLDHLVRRLRVPDFAATYFGDTQIDPPDSPGLCGYLDALKLRKTLQELWMRHLGAQALGSVRAPMQGWHMAVDETRGNALLNLQNTKVHDGYAVGVQVQHRSFKMFCAPFPSGPATPEQARGATDILHAMMVRANAGGAPTTSKRRGFTSVNVGSSPKDRDLRSWVPLVAACFERVIAAVPGDPGGSS